MGRRAATKPLHQHKIAYPLSPGSTHAITTPLVYKHIHPPTRPPTHSLYIHHHHLRTQHSHREALDVDEALEHSHTKPLPARSTHTGKRVMSVKHSSTSRSITTAAACRSRASSRCTSPSCSSRVSPYRLSQRPAEAVCVCVCVDLKVMLGAGGGWGPAQEESGLLLQGLPVQVQPSTCKRGGQGAGLVAGGSGACGAGGWLVAGEALTRTWLQRMKSISAETTSSRCQGLTDVLSA